MEDSSHTTQPRTERYTNWSLGVISFTESSFMPILVDPFLVALTLAKPHKWLWYALLATVTSVMGGLFGYLLGALFFDVVGERIVAFYNLESVFEKTVASFDANTFLFTLIGALTPIPYKIVALVGGFLNITIVWFIVASLIGRAARFMIVGYVTRVFGAYALSKLSKRVSMVTVAVVCGVGVYLAMSLLK